MPWSRRALLAEALFWLCAARLALIFVHFSWIARHLGQLRPPEPDVPVDPNGGAIAKEISWAVEKSARLLPFGVVCLPRALAGWQMLHVRKLPGRLHFGAIPGGPEKPLQTHAWLDAYGVKVTGYPVAKECVEIAFLSR